MALIQQLKDAAGLDIIRDEKERLDDEVGPFTLAPLGVKIVIMIATPVEVVSPKFL